MVIECPECRTRYRIDPSRVRKRAARVRCPDCGAVFSVDLAGRRKILVVDDSRFFRQMIVDMLQPLGHDFLSAGDGLEARDTIRRERPDLILLDLHLPGLTGIQLIEELRADPELAKLRILAMSGVYRREADAVAAERAGADAFIGKSFKPDQLQERVRSLLEDDLTP